MNEENKQPKRLFEVEIVETVCRRVLARDEAEASHLTEEPKPILSRCGSFIVRSPLHNR